MPGPVGFSITRTTSPDLITPAEPSFGTWRMPIWISTRTTGAIWRCQPVHGSRRRQPSCTDRIGLDRRTGRTLAEYGTCCLSRTRSAIGPTGIDPEIPGTPTPLLIRHFETGSGHRSGQTRRSRSMFIILSCTPSATSLTATRSFSKKKKVNLKSA